MRFARRAGPTGCWARDPRSCRRPGPRRPARGERRRAPTGPGRPRAEMTPGSRSVVFVGLYLAAGTAFIYALWNTLGFPESTPAAVGSGFSSSRRTPASASPSAAGGRCSFPTPSSSWPSPPAFRPRRAGRCCRSGSCRRGSRRSRPCSCSWASWRASSQGGGPCALGSPARPRTCSRVAVPVQAYRRRVCNHSDPTLQAFSALGDRAGVSPFRIGPSRAIGGRSSGSAVSARVC